MNKLTAMAPYIRLQITPTAPIMTHRRKGVGLFTRRQELAMTEEYAQISRGAKGDKELYFFIFMAIFWPTLLVTGLVAHFVFSGYELRLPTFVLSVIAGF